MKVSNTIAPAMKQTAKAQAKNSTNNVSFGKKHKGAVATAPVQAHGCQPLQAGAKLNKLA